MRQGNGCGISYFSIYQCEMEISIWGFLPLDRAPKSGAKRNSRRLSKGESASPTHEYMFMLALHCNFTLQYCNVYCSAVYINLLSILYERHHCSRIIRFSSSQSSHLAYANFFLCVLLYIDVDFCIKILG